jgi:hypothetical protein
VERRFAPSRRAPEHGLDRPGGPEPPGPARRVRPGRLHPPRLGPPVPGGRRGGTWRLDPAPPAPVPRSGTSPSRWWTWRPRGRVRPGPPDHRDRRGPGGGRGGGGALQHPGAPRASIPGGSSPSPGSPTRWSPGPPLRRGGRRRSAERLEGRVFTAHNVQFDWGFVEGHLLDARGEVPGGPLCTVKMGRALVPGSGATRWTRSPGTSASRSRGATGPWAMRWPRRGSWCTFWMRRSGRGLGPRALDRWSRSGGTGGRGAPAPSGLRRRQPRTRPPPHGFPTVDRMETQPDDPGLATTGTRRRPRPFDRPATTPSPRTPSSAPARWVPGSMPGGGAPAAGRRGHVRRGAEAPLGAADPRRRAEPDPPGAPLPPGRGPRGAGPHRHRDREQGGRKFREIYGVENEGTPPGSRTRSGPRGSRPTTSRSWSSPTSTSTTREGPPSGGTRREVEPAFPGARYVVQEGEFDFAASPTSGSAPPTWSGTSAPDPRRGLVLRARGRPRSPGGPGPPTPGHTPHHQSVLVRSDGETACYLADVCPTTAHIPLPWIMGYDLEPLVTLESKRALWKRARDEDWLLVFEHDPEGPLGSPGRGGAGDPGRRGPAGDLAGASYLFGLAGGTGARPGSRGILAGRGARR